MRVAFCPFYRTNPYQRRLAEELARLGTDVVPLSESSFFLIRSRPAWGVEVLHIHWPDHLLLAPGWCKTVMKSVAFLGQVLFCRLLGKRVVWTAHNLHDHERTHPRTQKFFLKRLARLAHRVIVHTPSAATRVAETFNLSPDKIRLVPHAHYVNDYPNTLAPAAAREQLQIAPATFVYLFLGSIRGYKGVADLIDAFLGLNQADSRLLIAGKPVDAETDSLVRARIAGDARIDYRPGYVADEALQLYFNAANVVVLPFADLLTSGSLLLVMSFAKACIVPDVSALTDVVPPTGAIVYDPKDPAGLVEALQAAQIRREELPEMGKRNLAAVEHWGWPEMAQATLDAYRK